MGEGEGAADLEPFWGQIEPTQHSALYQLPQKVIREREKGTRPAQPLRGLLGRGHSSWKGLADGSGHNCPLPRVSPRTSKCPRAATWATLRTMRVQR